MEFLNAFGNFVYSEFPFVDRWYQKLVVKPLQRPLWKIVRWVLLAAIVLGLAATFAPLPMLNFIHGHHWLKVLPIVRRVPIVRKVADFMYMFFNLKLKFVYVAARIIWRLVWLPLTVLMRAFGSIEKLRIIIVFTLLPAIMIRYAIPVINWILKELFRIERFSVGTSADPKSMAQLSMGVNAVIVAFAIWAYLRAPALYAFCYDTISPMTVVVTMVVIALYVQLSLIVFVDNVKAGRIPDKVKLTRTDMSKKQVELTLTVTSAAVVGLFLLRGANPGAFMRGNLLSPRLCAIE